MKTQSTLSFVQSSKVIGTLEKIATESISKYSLVSVGKLQGV